MADLVEAGPCGWKGSGLRLKYELVDVWRSPELDRALRNLADAVFRLQRIESEEAWRRELALLRERLAGEEWASLRRALALWIINVVLPSRLPGVSVPEAQDLDQLAGWMETNMKPWSEYIRAEALAEGEAKGLAQGEAKGRAEGRIRQLVSMARQKFGESAASAMAALLGTVTSEAVLDEVGQWLLSCRSGDALIAKLREI